MDVNQCYHCLSLLIPAQTATEIQSILAEPFCTKREKNDEEYKKVRKVIPFIVGSESQVVMEWKKSGMIERQRDGCMKGEYDI